MFSFTPVAACNIYSDCDTHLDVYGSFGTLSDTTSSENPNTGTQCNFSPEMYLSEPTIAPPNDDATSYDLETSLPAVL
jgi:hypothetical protein